MLAELILYGLTPAPGWARKAGYLRESIALGARHNRCRNAWAPHLRQTRSVIETVLKERDHFDHIVVAGSGHGFDLPLDALARSAGKVTLIDAVHPLSMRLKARAHSNLTLLEAELTGTDGPLPQINAEPDLIISLNVISQLGLRLSPTARPALRQHHLDWLQQFDATRLLIGDRRRKTIHFDEAGEQERIEFEGIDPFPTGEPIARWSWDLAPKGEIDRAIAVSTEVEAHVF